MYNEKEDKPKIFYEIASKKSELEANLKKLEKSVYDFETKYLEVSNTCGNILKGWDHIFTLKSKISTGVLQPTLKRTKFPFNERIFSQTSFNNSSFKDESLGIPASYNQIKNSINTVNNQEKESNDFLRKKIKKKMYSSLSIKKNKKILNGSSVKIHDNI